VTPLKFRQVRHYDFPDNKTATRFARVAASLPNHQMLAY
jgi:hypothetical protein